MELYMVLSLFTDICDYYYNLDLYKFNFIIINYLCGMWITF